MDKLQSVDRTLDWLSLQLAPYTAFVTYLPLEDEVRYQDLLPLPTSASWYELPSRKEQDTSEEALAARAWASGKRSAVFVPGQRFDAYGTRHGRGGGWYDRFLSYVPNEWLRVGFCRTDQFSEALLPSHPWDQPVDIVCIPHHDGLRVVETGARGI